MKRLTQDEFLRQSAEVWGDRWDYSETHYLRMAAKVTLICKDHGAFAHYPQAHLRGLVGCGECNGQKPLSLEEFTARSIEVHGPERFDLSRVNLGNGGGHQKVVVVCIAHQIAFEIYAWSFVRGQVGCWKCNPTSKMNEEKLRWKAASVYPTKAYDYTRVDFSIDVRKRNVIGCPVSNHGFFEQSLDGHLSGREGCPKCAQSFRLMDLNEFQAKSTLMWGSLYDYTNLELDRSNGKPVVTLTCRTHGPFTYSAARHLLGLEGCEACRSKFGPSKGEREIGNFIESLGLTIQRNERTVLKGKEIDVYIPSLNLGIEYNGLYYHSEQFLTAEYHHEKWQLAKDANVRLVQIWEDDWRERRSTVESHLAHVVGQNNQPKVYARSAKVDVVSGSQAKVFLEANHIQGYTPASVYLGLFSRGKLVALALFKKSAEDFVLSRYATSVHVVGGHSRLISHFEKTHSYGKLITFADLTFSDGALYRETGWVEDAQLSPDYAYLVKGKRAHKFGFRLKRFEEDEALIFRPGLTEKELAKLNGLQRIWDAGKIRFVKPHPSSESIEARLIPR